MAPVTIEEQTYQTNRGTIRRPTEVFVQINHKKEHFPSKNLPQAQKENISDTDQPQRLEMNSIPYQGTLDPSKLQKNFVTIHLAAETTN